MSIQSKEIKQRLETKQSETKQAGDSDFGIHPFYGHYHTKFPTIYFDSSFGPPKEELFNYARKLFHYISMSKEALELLKQESQENLFVMFLPAKDKGIMSTAQIDYHKGLGFREIKIRKPESDYELLRRFIFELCNSNNSEIMNLDIPQSIEEFLKKYPTANSFAEHLEKLEYNTCKKAAEIINSGQQKYGWPKSKDAKQDIVLPLDEHFKHIKFPDTCYLGYSHFGQYKLKYFEIAIRLLNSKISDLKFWNIIYNVTCRRNSAAGKKNYAELTKCQSMVLEFEHQMGLLRRDAEAYLFINSGKWKSKVQCREEDLITSEIELRKIRDRFLELNKELEEQNKGHEYREGYYCDLAEVYNKLIRIKDINTQDKPSSLPIQTAKEKPSI